MSERVHDRRDTGVRGEELAATYLTARGWTLLARNWRCRSGEIDIIARDPDGVLVVCELRPRRGLGYGDPLEAITYAKVKRLRGLAMEWVRSQEFRVGPVRLDAVGVLVGPDGLCRVRHVVNLEVR